MTTHILQSQSQIPKFYDFEKSNNRRNMRGTYVKSDPPSWAFVSAAWLLWLVDAAHRLAGWVDDRALLIEAYVWHSSQRLQVRGTLLAGGLTIAWVAIMWVALETAKGGIEAWILSGLPVVLSA